MYSLVEFLESHDVEIVSSHWTRAVGTKLVSYWPHNSSNISKAVQSCEAPNKDTWKQYDCRLLYKTDDYTKAREKLRLSEITSQLESDINTDEIDNGLRRSKRKRHKPVISDDEEDRMCNHTVKSQPNVHKAPRMAPLPAVPSLFSNSGESARCSTNRAPLSRLSRSPSTLGRRSTDLQPSPDRLSSDHTPLPESSLNGSGSRDNSTGHEPMPRRPSPSPSMSGRRSIDLQPPSPDRLASGRTPLSESSWNSRDHSSCRARLPRSSPTSNMLIRRSINMQPSPDRLSSGRKRVPGCSSNRSGSNDHFTGRAPLPRRPSPSSSISGRRSENDNGSYDRSLGHESSRTVAANQFRQPRLVSGRNEAVSHKLPSNCTAFERLLLTQFEEVKNSISELHQLQLNASSKLDLLACHAGVASMAAELPDDINFPLRRISEVDELETKLDDRRLLECLVNSVSAIGGASVKEATRRILRYIMTDNCAKNYNWKGKGEKMAFSSLQLNRVVIKAVRKNALTARATEAAIEHEIKEWLKFAPVRLRAKTKRDAHKMLREQIA